MVVVIVVEVLQMVSQLYILWGVGIMSVLKANKIIGNVVDAGTKFTVDNDSTYIEGNNW